MTDGDIHSMVIASDYRIPDPAKVWPLLERRKAALADIGAHHVLVYTSTHDYGRVLVMIGVHSREPIVELLRSRVFFDWFDAVGVEDIRRIRRRNRGPLCRRTSTGNAQGARGGGGRVRVGGQRADAERRSRACDGSVHRRRYPQDLGIPGFRRFARGADPAGVSRRGQRPRMDRAPGCGGAMAQGVGIGAYPPLFVGRFADMIRIGTD